MMVASDGTKLATDVYLPPDAQAPSVVLRTPYGRAEDRLVGCFMSLARRGFAVISQDCRGTGDSEPDDWDYYVFEPDDSFDLVAWVTGQKWYNGFIGSFGSSYLAQTQWCMAAHPAMSAIIPHVSGLGVARNTVGLHMFVNAYARSVGKGGERVDLPYDALEQAMLAETLSTGLFNEPIQDALPTWAIERFPDLKGRAPDEGHRQLWSFYCAMSCAERAQFICDFTGSAHVTICDIESLTKLFGPLIAHDRHTLPRDTLKELAQAIKAPPLFITGWYDWGLNDALATWQLIRSSAMPAISDACRMIITPSAHNAAGYKERMATAPALRQFYNMYSNLELNVQWWESIAEGRSEWPRVTYYLMGANEWHTVSDWPPPEATDLPLYLRDERSLGVDPPAEGEAHDTYLYDPSDPTPTRGGSIVSYVVQPGSCDVADLHSSRRDLLVYTSEPLSEDLTIAGPLKLIIYASSDAPDTDFVGRISDVFPDGRAIQLQNGALRARYREDAGSAKRLTPGEVYRLEIDMWATANRFKAGHRIRLDISSADFPRFDRNTNLAGFEGPPQIARQTIHRSVDKPSHVILPVLRDQDGCAGNVT
jgi:hypothetical protein